MSMAVVRRKVLLLTVVLLLCSSSLYASRVKDLGSSQNGQNKCQGNAPSCLCPSASIPASATPFLVPLDGTKSPPAGCDADNGDPNDPNPPNPYPGWAFTLQDVHRTFTVTITPVLWEFAEFPADTKKTILQVQFSGQPGMTLRSLVIGTVLAQPTYVICDPNQPGGSAPYCTPVITNEEEALQPAPVTLADNTNTRWDFSQFTSGTSLSLVVKGFPVDFQNIDIFPDSNALTQASFSSSNFLAIVQDGNNVLTAGGLTLQTAPAATNDKLSQAIAIELPYQDFVDTSATNPQENPTTGGEINNQMDPPPPCSTHRLRVFRSVWYTYTAAATGTVTVSTLGSRYDTLLYVFTRSLGRPHTVACNDDGLYHDIGAVESDVTFNAISGQTYNIMVSEAPPDVLTLIEGGGPIAVPLSNDATLNISVVAGADASFDHAYLPGVANLQAGQGEQSPTEVPRVP